MKNAGIYLLLIRLPRARNIKIGKLGTFFFKKGYYIYVGSAQRNLSQRINRHKNKKKILRWHIDYLIKYASLLCVKSYEFSKKYECALCQYLSKLHNAEILSSGFGASDCKCATHLLFFRKKPEINKNLSYFFYKYKLIISH